MSTRALRALRGETAGRRGRVWGEEEKDVAEDEEEDSQRVKDDDESTDDQGGSLPNRPGRASAFLLHDGGSSSSDEDDEDREEGGKECEDEIPSEERPSEERPSGPGPEAASGPSSSIPESLSAIKSRRSNARPGKDDNNNKNKNKKSDGNSLDLDDDEDLDAILSEFRVDDDAMRVRRSATDGGGGAAEEGEGPSGPGSEMMSSSSVDMLLVGLDLRDLDVERSRNAALRDGTGAGGDDQGGGGGGGPMGGRRRRNNNIIIINNNNNPARGRAAGGGGGASRRRGSGQNLLFGHPQSDWACKPPTYVGGGIGIAPYGDPQLCRRSSSGAADAAQPTMPWPYCDASLLGESTLADTNRWFAFTYSDLYSRDAADYADVIEQSGDPNALVRFVYHHPFCVPALLQLSAAMLEVEHRHRAENRHYATTFLRRALYVLESSILPSLVRRIQESTAVPPAPPSAPPVLLDYDLPENRPVFDALGALVRIGSLSG
jgi:hypothetical protein